MYRYQILARDIDLAIAVYTKLCNRKEVAVLVRACIYTILHSTLFKSAVQSVLRSLERILDHKIYIVVYAFLWPPCCLHLSSSQAHCKGTEPASVTYSPRFTLPRTKQISESSNFLCYAYGVSGSKESKSQARTHANAKIPDFFASQNGCPCKPKIDASAAKSPPSPIRCEIFSYTVRRRAYICRVLVLKTWCCCK